MIGSGKHRIETAFRAWRLLAKRLICVGVAIAIALIPATPPGTSAQEDMSTVSMSFNVGEQGPANISSHAHASHMDLEHHQLVRSENAFVIPPPVSIRVGYLIDVNWIHSGEPAPLYRSPRA
jgi:hypothetical protein